MHKPPFPALALLVLFLPPATFLLPQAWGQSVISARSGLVNYFEGVVFLDGQPLARKAGTFARMREGSTLLTESGRAEVLLTPDTYLRIGADSSIRMIATDIDDTQVELLSGSSILDSAQAPAGTFIRIIFQDATIRFLKPGHYRMDADPAQLRVYEGEAEVSRNGSPVKIGSSQLMPLDGAPIVKRFTQGSDGLLDLWSEERGSLIASNMLNSQSISDPLLDTGAGVPADLASFIGYIPLATIQPVGLNSYGLNSYGYGLLYPSYSVFSPYPSLAALAFRPVRPTPLLYPPRYGITPVNSGIYSRPTFPSQPRPIFTPRPAMPAAPRVGIGIHPVGRR